MKHGWEIKKLGEVCRFINGRAYSKTELLSKGKYPVLRVGNFFTNNQWYYSDLELEEDKYCDNGDLLYAWSASFGPRIWEGEKVIYHYHIWKVEPDTNIVSKEFLFQLLEWDTEALKTAHGTGTTMMHVGKGSIEKRLVPIPPLPEQQRIVSILDEAFAAIARAKANTEQNLKNAKELFESYLQGVFENKGEGWEIKTLGEVSKINYGYTEKASFDEVGPKFLRITDIQENGVDWDTVPYCKCSDKDLPKYKLEKGDIVFARTGATTGKSYLIDNPPISVFASYLIRLRMNSINEFIPEFISYFFQTKTYWDKINAGISGSAQGGFNATKLGELEFHFPKSKTEQQAIVRQLDALRAETQKLEAVYQKKIDDLEELKKSILQKAFAGELKTSQEVV